MCKFPYQNDTYYPYTTGATSFGPDSIDRILPAGAKKIMISFAVNTAGDLDIVITVKMKRIDMLRS